MWCAAVDAHIESKILFVWDDVCVMYNALNSKISSFLQVLCIYPRLIHPWPVAGIAVWLGLVQDLLIPIGLGIVDSRFCQWVSNVYRCSSKSVEEKLPHGKYFYKSIRYIYKKNCFQLVSMESFDLFHQVSHKV